MILFSKMSYFLQTINQGRKPDKNIGFASTELKTNRKRKLRLHSSQLLRSNAMRGSRRLDSSSCSRDPRKLHKTHKHHAT